MYFLVQFENTRHAVVTRTAISSCDPSAKEWQPELNTVVNVQWADNKLYTAKILRCSTSKKYLSDLHVFKTGDVYSQKSKKLKEHKDAVLAIEKKSLAIEKKKGAQISKAVKKQNAEILLDRQLSDATDYDSLSAKIHKEVRKTEIEERREEIIEAAASCSHKNRSDIQETSTDNISKVHAISESYPVVPRVTAEMILSAQLTLDYLKARFALESAENSPNKHRRYSSTDEVPSKMEVDKILPKWKIPREGKVQLVKNSGVWVDSADLEYITGMWLNKPKEMMRRLLKLILGSENIH